MVHRSGRRLDAFPVRFDKHIGNVYDISINITRFYNDLDGSPHSIPLADHPDDYTTEITGRIYFFDGDVDEEGKEVKIGEISMSHVNLSGAMDDNQKCAGYA